MTQMISRLIAIGFAAVLAVSEPAFADEALEAAVADLARGSFAEKIDAVGHLAASGDPRIVPVLEAFLGGQLYTRKADDKVVIGKSRGRVLVLTEPLTETQLGEAARSEVAPIRINNRLRGLTRAALGGLTLLSPDAGTRLGAAGAVFKARTAEMEPLLQTALERETDSRVRKRMEQALAAIRLTHSKESEARIEALGVLSGASDQDVRALVAGVLFKDAQGEFRETDADVRAAAEEALVKIESRLALRRFGVNLFQGVSLGSVLLLAAVGLAITFGVMGVINMAHGEMVMLGAYTTFVVQEQFRRYAPEAFDYSLAVAVPAAFLVAAAVGIAIERGIIRHLYGRPLETLLATWGLSLILQQIVRTVFGPSNREVGNPSWMSGAIEAAGGFTFTYNRIWIIVFSLSVFALLILVMRKTAFGLRMRAVTQNRPMAAAMGIRTGWIDAYTFALGSGIAGLAGVALSQIDNVSPNLGQSYIIDSFLVVVFGGVGNLWGTLVGALSLGLVTKFLEPYAGAVLAKIVVLIAIILFIQKRPRGMFALRGRSVEA
jgi:urea transport system permease protein